LKIRARLLWRPALLALELGARVSGASEAVKATVTQQRDVTAPVECVDVFAARAAGSGLEALTRLSVSDFFTLYAAPGRQAQDKQQRRNPEAGGGWIPSNFSFSFKHCGRLHASRRGLACARQKIDVVGKGRS